MFLHAVPSGRIFSVSPLCHVNIFVPASKIVVFYRTCWQATIFLLCELLSIHSTSFQKSWNSSCPAFCSKINERHLENRHSSQSHFFYSSPFLFSSRNAFWSEHAHFLGTCWTRRQRQLDPLMYNSCHVSSQPHQMVRCSTVQTKRASCGKTFYFHSHHTFHSFVLLCHPNDSVQ